MARYGTLGDYRFPDQQEAASDIRGCKVYGPDDHKLGEIDDVVFDESTGAILYAVVDTGGWLSSKKFLVPPQKIRPSVQHKDDYRIDLTKEQIESFPAYDGKSLSSEEKWADYERKYRSKWSSDEIMHREGTDRNITPTTKQQVHSGSGAIPAMPGTGTRYSTGTGSSDPRMVSSDSTLGSDAEADFEELDNETEITAVHPEVDQDISPNMPDYRWNSFEGTLRRRREEVLQSSIDLAKREDRERMREGEDIGKRKAS